MYVSEVAFIWVIIVYPQYDGFIETLYLMVRSNELVEVQVGYAVLYTLEVIYLISSRSATLRLFLDRESKLTVATILGPSQALPHYEQPPTGLPPLNLQIQTQ